MTPSPVYIKKVLQERLLYTLDKLRLHHTIKVIEARQYQDILPIPNSSETVFETLVQQHGFPKKGSITIGHVLTILEQNVESLISITAQEIHHTVQLFVEEKVRESVLARRNLTERWAWSIQHPAGIAAHLLHTLDRSIEELGTTWPGEAAAIDVAEWACHTLNIQQHGLGDNMLALAKAEKWPIRWTLFETPKFPLLVNSIPQHDPHSSIHPQYNAKIFPTQSNVQIELHPTSLLTWQRPNEQLVVLTPGNLALTYLVWREVQNDRQRPAIAVDAGKHHHALIEGFREMEPKNPLLPSSRPIVNGRIQLIEKSKPIQLGFPLPGDTLHEAAIHALRQLRSWKGLRHWAALQRLFSIEGNRRGWVRWTLDSHLSAMGYKERKQRDPQFRKQIGREVEMLTELELVVFSTDQTEFDRRPLIMVGSRFGRIEEGESRIEGMELIINPLLYKGIRNDQNGKPGKNWFPASSELACIDHIRYPYAIALGLILSMRWRWDLLSGKKCLHLSGRELLKIAGIHYPNKHDPKRPWEALERNLSELQQRHQLGHWKWYAEKYTPNGMCDLYPPPWMVDRSLRGVLPMKLPAIQIPQTGTELQTWQKNRGLTQLIAAKRLGISRRTFQSAIAAPKKRLGSIFQKVSHDRWA